MSRRTILFAQQKEAELVVENEKRGNRHSTERTTAVAHAPSSGYDWRERARPYSKVGMKPLVTFRRGNLDCQNNLQDYKGDRRNIARGTRCDDDE